MGGAHPLLQPPEEFILIVLMNVNRPCMDVVKDMIVLLQQGV